MFRILPGALPFFLSLSFFALSASTVHAFTVVLDPGHGGKDTGAKAGETEEKNLVLLIAHDIKEALREKGIKVHMTRDDDQAVSLDERVALSTAIKPDAFLSIHLNSEGPTRRPSQGIETYILNKATPSTSRKLEHLEKKSDVNSDLDFIVKDLKLDGQLPKSRDLACSLQSHIVKNAVTEDTPRKKLDRGVRQSQFMVLFNTETPSILLELGFLSHPVDRDRILNLEKRKRLVTGVVEGLLTYQGIIGGTLKSPENCKIREQSSRELF
jgi:N-acetylmuramoyl-L-alanine amidase